MKKLLVILAICFASAVHAGGVPGQPSGSVTSAETATIVGPIVTINAQCVTPTSGCAAGQGASIKVGGRTSITAQILTTNFTGTFSPYASADNGVSWFSVLMRTNTNASISFGNSPTTVFGVAANTAVYVVPVIIATGVAVTDVMIAQTAAPTNTATIQMMASAQNPSLQGVQTAKGSQTSGTLALSTQDVKDSGRSFIVLGADGVTPAISDTLITFAKNVAGAVTGAQTTYAITSGKTLRVQSLCASFTAGAAANIARVRLRLNTGGACLVGSGLLLPALELAPQYGTATASEGWAAACVPIPDGLELTGTSWNICISESAVAASGTLTVNLIGYEY